MLDAVKENKITDELKDCLADFQSEQKYEEERVAHNAHDAAEYLIQRRIARSYEPDVLTVEKVSIMLEKVDFWAEEHKKSLKKSTDGAEQPAQLK